MSPILEPSYYALFAGKQTAQGTPLAAPTRRLVQVAGDFAWARDDGSEEYSDLSKYSPRTDWVNSLLGQGEPGIEATPTELAWLLWIYHGAETVAAVTGPPAAQKHTFVPSTGRGHFAAFWRVVGNLVQQSHRMNDCIINGITIEGSTANKAVRVTPSILSLDPGEVFAKPSTPVIPTDKPFLYTDGTSSFTMDSTVYKEQTEFSLSLTEDLRAEFGDDIIPADLAQGNPGATIGITMLASQAVVNRWNTRMYGSASPAAGTKPLKAIDANGSYSAYLKQRDSAGALNGREFKLTIPSVRWTIPPAPGPDVGGATPTIAFAGELRPSGSPLYTIDVNTANTDVAFTG